MRIHRPGSRLPALALALLAAIPLLARPATADARPDLDDASLVTYLGEALAEPRIEGVPRPESVVGFEIGSWHLRPEQLERYFDALAESSPRVRLEITGWTHERRPLLLATITSARNHARLEQIRQRQKALADPTTTDPVLSSGVGLEDLPAVVYLAYSVHGNEASGSNAAPVVAWHLASSTDPDVEALLDEVVVLLDPMLNPDGLARFAHWANMHRGRVATADPEHREHREPWPSGRTNHYWTDLNRDWLLARHPETRARLETFHRWRPNLLADFHEMGTSSTYFFQPGVPSRNNPLTPAATFELTQEVASFHARALDDLGSLYFTEEQFDDFYYGKGSTYPDIHGAVGVLFEQASARGHRQEARDGSIVSFPFAIRNQVATSLSTLEAARALRLRLLEHQRDAYRQALDEARSSSLGGYVVGDDADPARLAELVDLLRVHEVEVRSLAEERTIGGVTWRPESSIVVPHAQPQARLVRALFEERVDFEDDTFYDVSAWTLPHSFGLPFAQLSSAEVESTRPLEDAREVPGTFVPGTFVPGTFVPDPDAVAYAFRWNDLWAPRALRRLLDAGVRARVAVEPLTAGLGRGSILVPLGIQELGRDRVEKILADADVEDRIDLVALGSGLARVLDGSPAGSDRSGLDLGSPNLAPLERPTPALVVGEATFGDGNALFEASAYESGEVWHLLDARFGIETTLLEASRLGRADLSRYSHLIFAGAGPRAPGEAAVEAIRTWIRDGGVLIATRGASDWVSKAFVPAGDDETQSTGSAPVQPNPEVTGPVPEIAPSDAAETGTEADLERRPYAERDRDVAKTLLSGAILEVDLDLTHPLAFGYRRPTLPVMRRGTGVLPAPRDPYSAVAVYRDAPLLAGYASTDALVELAGTPALLADRVERGLVVRFADNPAFRGVWHGTEKLLLNALFFGSTIERTRTP